MCLSYSAKYIWFGIACCSRDVLRGRNKATTSLSRTALTLNWEPFSISSEKIINNSAIIFKTFQSIIRLTTHEFYKSVAFSYHKVSHQQHSILENTFDNGLFLNKNWYSCSLWKCFRMENYVDFSYRANLLKSWNEIPVTKVQQLAKRIWFRNIGFMLLFGSFNCILEIYKFIWLLKCKYLSASKEACSF